MASRYPNKDHPKKKAPERQWVRIPKEILVEFKECPECEGYGLMNFCTHYTTVDKCNRCDGLGHVLSQDTRADLVSFRDIIRLLKL